MEADRDAAETQPERLIIEFRHFAKSARSSSSHRHDTPPFVTHASSMHRTASFAARHLPRASLHSMAKEPKSDSQSGSLKGWKQIVAFLAQPVAVVQRWARSGMPVEKRGRYVYSSPEVLNRWLGRSAGEPVQIATDDTNLGAELRRGLSFVRSHSGKKKRAA